MTEHVSLLVNLAALPESPTPEALSNCRSEPLAAVDDEEVALVCIESALDQIIEQLAADSSILRRSHSDS